MQLPIVHGLAGPQLRLILEDWDRPLPEEPGDYIADRYGLDITGRYGGRIIKNPFGKASGQLSLQVRQVQGDAHDGARADAGRPARRRGDRGHEADEHHIR